MRLTPGRLLLILASGLFLLTTNASAAGERVTLTFIIASNQGRDINIDNDAYRDQMIKLFSYSSYQQIGRQAVELEPQKTETASIPGGYDLMLTLKGTVQQRNTVQAVIRKDGKTFVDTVLTLTKPGVFFLGGPPAENGALIIVLEMGF